MEFSRLTYRKMLIFKTGIDFSHPAPRDRIFKLLQSTGIDSKSP